MRKADFELSGQILRAVDRFLGVERRYLLPILIGEKYLVISRTPRRHLARHCMRQFVQIEWQLGVEIVDRACDGIAIHVAARAERRQLVAAFALARVDVANQRTQIVPAHEMELDALPRRQPDTAVGVKISGRVECEPLRGSQLTAAGFLTRTMKMKSPSFLPLSLRSRCL